MVVLVNSLLLEQTVRLISTFKTTSTNEIIELSHLEKAWKENEQTKNVISYEYAFELIQI